MRLAKVRGTVVSTVKDDTLMGVKLLLVQLIEASGDLQNEYEVGEWVLVSRGSAARQQQGYEKRPVDAAIIAIVDTVSLDSGLLYDKREEFR
jgi:carbon dioxide concentrating mechanism protein CcmL